jgi:hypothetical protein
MMRVRRVWRTKAVLTAVTSATRRAVATTHPPQARAARAAALAALSFRWPQAAPPTRPGRPA